MIARSVREAIYLSVSRKWRTYKVNSVLNSLKHSGSWRHWDNEVFAIEAFKIEGFAKHSKHMLFPVAKVCDVVDARFPDAKLNVLFNNCIDKFSSFVAGVRERRVIYECDACGVGNNEICGRGPVKPKREESRV